MRDIKFKAETLNGEILTSMTIAVYKRKGYHNTYFIETAPNRFREIDYDTLTQYTGFKDKNGKEIFDNSDIKIWIPDTAEENGGSWVDAKVSFMNGCYVVTENWFDYSDSKFPDDYTFLYEVAKDCEVNDEDCK